MTDHEIDDHVYTVVTRATFRSLRKRGFNRRSVWKRLRNIEGDHIIAETVCKDGLYYWRVVCVIANQYGQVTTSTHGLRSKAKALMLGLRVAEDAARAYKSRER